MENVRPMWYATSMMNQTQTATAITLTTNDESRFVNFTVGDSYNVIKDAVNGWIECVRLHKGIDMWVNEEGAINGMPYNATATAIYWTTYGFMSGQIFGDVIFASNDGMGETTGLTTEQVDYLNEIAFEIVGIRIQS